jgi:hypothetical protein
MLKKYEKSVENSQKVTATIYSMYFNVFSFCYYIYKKRIIYIIHPAGISEKRKTGGEEKPQSV